MRLIWLVWMGIKWTEYRVGRRWSFSQSLSFVEPRAHDNVNLSFRCVSKLEAVVSISILTGIDQDPFLGGVPPLSGTDFFTTGKHRRKRPSWVMVLRSWSWAIVRLAKAEFLWVARRHGAEVLGNGWEVVGIDLLGAKGSHPFYEKRRWWTF